MIPGTVHAASSAKRMVQIVHINAVFAFLISCDRLP